MPDSSPHTQALPTFWRDDALPFVEARSIEDGRGVCYAKHAHETFSIGAITGGRSIYLNGRSEEHVGVGSVVVVNPDQVHACNPIDGKAWSYRMLHVDAGWLADLQREQDDDCKRDFRPFSPTLAPELFVGLNRLVALLSDSATDNLHKHCAVVRFFSDAQPLLARTSFIAREADHKLHRAAQYINDNFARALSLEEICAAAGLSPSYLIRAFNRRYGMTPHSYLVNRRIQYGRAQLRRGRAIAEVAADAGFADQAHFQRAFKQFVATTPGHYRGVIRKQQPYSISK